MARTLIDFDIEWEIEKMFDKVWSSAERQGVTWQEVHKAFEQAGIDGFDEWWKEGEE